MCSEDTHMHMFFLKQYIERTDRIESIAPIIVLFAVLFKMMMIYAANTSSSSSLKWAILAIVLIAYNSHNWTFGHGAPLNSSMADYTSPEELMELIKNSGLEDQCEIDQNLKDQCELCMRFLFDRRGGYHGCCTNYDGIYDFCQSLLNYSFEEQQQDNKILSTTKSNNHTKTTNNSIQ